MEEKFFKHIKTVSTPLLFFALAIVVIGSMFSLLITKSILPADITIILVYGCFLLFALLLLLVTGLIIFYPKKLTFDKEAHITVLREQLGDSELGYSYYSDESENIKLSSSHTKRINESKKEGDAE